MRVADLFVADPDQLHVVLERILPPTVSQRVAHTGAGAVVTLETPAGRRGLRRRVNAVRRLTVLLTAVRSALETAEQVVNGP